MREKLTEAFRSSSRVRPKYRLWWLFPLAVDCQALQGPWRQAGYNPGMNTQAILQSLDEEIARLERVRTLLSAPKTPPAGKRRTMSPEGRARVAAAQRARWAKTKR